LQPLFLPLLFTLLKTKEKKKVTNSRKQTKKKEKERVPEDEWWKGKSAIWK
jgi:hypothetical protein